MIASRGDQLVHTSSDRDDLRTIDRCAFTRLVALHCRLSGHDPDARDLDQWLASVWPMVSGNMEPARWARAYLIACGLERETEATPR